MLSKKKFEEIKRKFPVGTVFECIIDEDNLCEITEELNYDDYISCNDDDIYFENSDDYTCYLYDNDQPKKLAKIISKKVKLIQIY